MSEYNLNQLVRNNCACCSSYRDCENCEIDEQVILAFKEWLIQQQITCSDEKFAFDVETLWGKYRSERSQVRKWSKDEPFNAFAMGYMLAQKELIEKASLNPKETKEEKS